MSKSIWLVSAGLLALSAPAWAQDTITGQAGAAPPAGAATPTADPTAQGAVQQPAASGAAATAATADEAPGEIIVTATRRASPLSSVPIAVTAVTAEQLQNSGATDIRQLNQVSPSLLVSSTSTEAAGGGARIRGVGTVGDNPGLESSVATFIDGVYRNRSGVALTELGPVERIEVLRGPQGTLFGRNASAGLINIVTARPKFQDEGYAEATYGNYDNYRLAGGVTGPIGQSGLAYRLDGVWTKRDGFIKDVISGRDINDRNRWLARGKLLYEKDDLSVLLIGDYSHRNEECCVGVYLPAQNVTRAADGSLVSSASTIAGIIRSTTSLVPGAGVGQVLDDTYDRKVALTPGQNYNAHVKDYGGSAEINYDLGGAKIASITAYRVNDFTRGQDADFNNLDLFHREDDGHSYTKFRTFSQELRVQGEAFAGKLDWLIGGYFAHETLRLGENTKYGVDYDQYIAKVVRAQGAASADPTTRALLSAFPGYNNLQAFGRGVAATLLATNPAFAGVPAAARPALAAAAAAPIANVALGGTGIQDRFKQVSRNYALFTHNIFNVTDTLSVTLGARYTKERKTLDADLTSNSGCGVYLANIAALRTAAATSGANPAVAGLQNALATQILPALAAGPCGPLSAINGDFKSRKNEGEWSGTGVLSYKPTPKLLTYASYSRGYKAGGFNLDRAPLAAFVTAGRAIDADALQFQPEKVDAFELGAKFDGRKFDLNVAAFYQLFKSFQLNTFSGTNFFVTDIRGCKDDLGATDSDNVANNSACGKGRSGLVSKGVEVEAFFYPVRDLSLTGGVTYADTRYRGDLSGTPDAITGNNSLQPALSLLPGSRLSNSSKWVGTGAATWTPAIGSKLRGLAYADFRYTSRLNTGSDLFVEKQQKGFFVVNARIGIGGADRGWSLELWAQNLLNKDYKQVAFSTPLQGSNTSAAQLAAGQTTTQLFSAFLAEPRTYGLTVRTKF